MACALRAQTGLKESGSSEGMFDLIEHKMQIQWIMIKDNKGCLRSLVFIEPIDFKGFLLSAISSSPASQGGKNSYHLIKSSGYELNTMSVQLCLKMNNPPATTAVLLC